MGEHATDFPRQRVTACVGLLSDTHWPERLDALPAALFDVFSGVDLILHAGDVGELRVLDDLSALAPVVAVHGNDDTAEAQRELPYQQVVAVAGQRIALSHAHNPVAAEEAASRRVDDWAPKLARWAGFGHRAGAGIVVLGHTHIPLVARHEGVLLVNPGAIAPPNFVTRQTRRTVALLYLQEGAEPVVAHVDLAAPERRFVPAVDWSAGFAAASRTVVASILAPDLEAAWPDVRRRLEAAGPVAAAAARSVLARAARRCWAGEQDLITRDDLRRECEAQAAQAARAALLAVLG